MDKEAMERILKVCQSLIEMLDFAFQAFRKPTEESIRKAGEAMDRVRKYSSELTGFLISTSSSSREGRVWAKPYLSIASSFDRMMFNIEGIVERLKSKAQNHILFSEEGVKETNDVFQEAMDILESLPDLILTPNEPLAQQIREMGRSLFKIASEYSEGHEERLIQGICKPKSGPIYLGILECLKGIIGNTLDVSDKIVSLSSKS